MTLKPKKKSLKRKNPRDGGPDAESELIKWQNWANKIVTLKTGTPTDSQLRDAIKYYIQDLESNLKSLENYYKSRK